MIINSLLDTDLYKFTMMQTVLHQFPAAQVEYRFKCRNQGVDLRPMVEDIKKEIDHLCSLRFEKAELDYLSTLRFLKHDFIDFLRLFQLNADFVTIQTEPEFDLIIRGPWVHTILFEIPLLAIVNETYFRHTQPTPDYSEGRRRLTEKIDMVKALQPYDRFLFSDFGTRRRFNREWHYEVVDTLIKELPNQFTGTSNVHLARTRGIKPIGTMAHEFLQACQALGVRLVDSQKFALETWVKEYRGDLGIALTDVCGVDAFLRDFDLYFCKLFDGVRHDSGDPFIWGEKILAHYQQLRIDARSKTMVFSDGLTFPSALELYQRFHNRANTAFGIGTNLTNDLGYTPLNIVIKMTECNGQPVAKLSDSPGKTMCRDETYLAYLSNVFHIGKAA